MPENLFELFLFEIKLNTNANRSIRRIIVAKIDENYLAVMQMDNVDLLDRRQEQTPMGKLIRKEITRREKCNYWKGAYPTWKGGPDGEFSTPSVVGTVRTYVKGAS
jgi:hypothetical protein